MFVPSKNGKPDYVEFIRRVDVENVWVDFYHNSAVIDTERILAFAITEHGDLVGIYQPLEGKEDYCERQDYALKYYVAKENPKYKR